MTTPSTQATLHLLTQAGFPASIIAMHPCTRGGNNRTFRVETPTQTFALKEYFRQEGDKRDRLTSEYTFLTYANQAAPGMTPRPYAKDDTTGLALYEFINGDPLQTAKITKGDVIQAANFFRALNNPEMRCLATELPQASEACFALDEHLTLIANRIAGLQKITPEHPEDKQAQDKIANLSRRWDAILQQIKLTAQQENIDITETLSNENRCLSPSDFGFHNALKTPDGSIRFLDFEYAGWDDPAKMVGDFFSQLAVPVPAIYFDEFTQLVMQPFPSASLLQKRAQLLRKVYEVKWCCIALNIFIPVNLARRKFANPTLDVADLKKAQLSKVESLMQRLEAPYHV